MNILVIGAGKSGLSAAKLAISKGHSVFLTESDKSKEKIELTKQLEDLGIKYEFGSNNFENLNQYDLCVSSPGVPPKANIIKQVEKEGIKIISEIEFAYTCLTSSPKIIGITGTNGKTTTATLIHHILKESGKSVKLVGNVGTPLSDVVNDVNDNDILVIELSSYQLDRIDTFRVDVAIFLNITDDHLSYHGSFEHYLRAKWKITSNQSEDNLLVLNCDDKIIDSIINNEISSKDFVSGGEAFDTNAQIAKISLSHKFIDTMGGSQKDGNIVYKSKQQEEEIMSISNVPLFGEHNLYNTYAAVVAAKYLQIRNEDIRDAVSSFKGVQHRLEVVREMLGVKFINDSKATNVNSTWYALNSFKGNLVWLAGGSSSDNDYSVLEKLVESKVKYLICFGEEKNKLFDEFSGKVKCFLANSLMEATLEAAAHSKSGDTVLLSPACKSFDEFVNFEHRGDVFKEVVNSLV
ncbi:MAG: UDP-N-acetylmuramoyl-L-alanine--D-glutamate ligase [Chlorobiota bacterium]